ncbi:MAG: hypothetical protein LBQ50_14050 [Planctomycetaceae bacterium]|nr:hypothetical protein [Planctomycetaceae bacterium]
MSLLQKRFIGISLCAALLCPMLAAGCASKSKQTPTNVFSLPKWKKEESGRVKKDPDIPVTMSEAMMLPRNDF